MTAARQTGTAGRVLAAAEPIAVRSAMVLAAGRGTRLGATTRTTPKPLIEVGGRALIDTAIDALVAVGVERIVVNTFHLAERIEEHLARRADAEFVVLREERLLDTGGGVANALPHLGSDPVFVLNADLVWSGAASALARLKAAWRDPLMDSLLLLHPTVRASRYEGRGDFMLDAVGRVSRREEATVAPFVFTGAQIVGPEAVRAARAKDAEAFSLNAVFDRAIEAERLFGLVHEGLWMDAGTPERLMEAREIATRARQGRLW